MDIVSEKPVDLSNKEEVARSEWPQDMETVEINTEGWESSGQRIFVDQGADSPFQVIRVDKEQDLTPEEKEEKKTDEIIEMYQTKNGEPVVKHKSFFDELWEK